jgi:4-hydroxybenzoate polyprenyltransferase
MLLYLLILSTIPIFHGFIIPPIKTSKSSIRILKNHIHIADENPKLNKIASIGKLMRIESVLPTSVLCFMGGWINYPSVHGLIQSSSFWAASFATQCVMTGSMVINDIFDRSIDAINHPERPLINGSVSLSEAILLAIGLFGTAQLVALRFLPSPLPKIVAIVIGTLVLYTPVFKHIPFIKNLVCSSVVASSVAFVGYAVSGSWTSNPWLLTMTQLLFVCSIYIELLLDIHDCEGDRQHHIYTLPVLLGKDGTACFSLSMITLGTIDILYKTVITYPKIVPFGFLCVYLPFFIRLWDCKRNNYSAVSIKRATRKTMPSLLIALSMIMYLSSKKLQR